MEIIRESEGTLILQLYENKNGNVNPVKNASEKLANEAASLNSQKCQQEILLTDESYPISERKIVMETDDSEVIKKITESDSIKDTQNVTKEAIEILKANKLKFSLLTERAVNAPPYFDLIKDYKNARYGLKLLSNSNGQRPNITESLSHGIDSLKVAKEQGIKTWVDLDPTFEPDMTRKIVSELYQVVDQWKINGDKFDVKPESKSDWKIFEKDADGLLDSLGIGSPWTEGVIPIRRGNCKILVIAPHGHPNDDEKTYEIGRLVADKLDCYAFVNRTFKNPPKKKDPKTNKILRNKNGKPIRHEPNKTKKWINLNRLDQVHDHLESEFEKPLLNIVNEIIERYDKALVLWIHGIDDANLTTQNKNGNVAGTDALIGIGQGNPDHLTAYQRTAKELVSALEKNTISQLKVALAKKGSNYCGWHENIMNQYFRMNSYSLQNVESIQIEIRNNGFRQKENFENTAMAMSDSLITMAIWPTAESEQSNLVSAVQKGSLRQIKASEIDLENDQFMSRLDDITSDGMKFKSLVASINKNGILNNIIIRRRSDANGRPYQLISGFRRMTALQASISEKDKFANPSPSPTSVSRPSTNSPTVAEAPPHASSISFGTRFRWI